MSIVALLLFVAAPPAEAGGNIIDPLPPTTFVVSGADARDRLEGVYSRLPDVFDAFKPSGDAIESHKVEQLDARSARLELVGRIFGVKLTAASNVRVGPAGPGCGRGSHTLQLDFDGSSPMLTLYVKSVAINLCAAQVDGPEGLSVRLSGSYQRGTFWNPLVGGEITDIAGRQAPKIAEAIRQVLDLQRVLSVLKPDSPCPN